MPDEKYGLDPAFERLVAALCALRPKFLGQVGHALDHKMLDNEVAALCIKACQAIQRDTGRGPSSTALLMQRLRRWMGEGQVTYEQLQAVGNMIVMAPIPLPTDDEVAAELVPVLQRKQRHAAIQAAMDDFANKRDMNRVQKILAAADRLGVQDSSLGLRVGPEAFAEVRKLRHMDRLPLGIPELDAVLGGGVKRGTATVFVAGSGRGKSQMLSHIGAYNVAQGLFVGYVTLELAEALVFARVAGNLSLVPVTLIEEDERYERKALKRMRRMFPILGTMLIKEMPPKQTTMLDVRAWVKECEEQVGRPMDVLLLDYADKLVSHRREDKNNYDGMGTVYDDFRYFVHHEKKWGATASQAKRGAGKDKNRRVEGEDVADSINKLRSVDYCITLSGDGEDNDQVRYFVSKNRTGRQDVEVGPLPHDWAHGRMVMGSMYDTVLAALKRSAT